MLKCRELTQSAGDYVDHELPWHKSLSIAMHLLMCGHCRRFMHYFRISLKSLRGRPAARLDPEKAEEIYLRATARE